MLIYVVMKHNNKFWMNMCTPITAVFYMLVQNYTFSYGFTTLR